MTRCAETGLGRRDVCFSVMTARTAMPNILRAVSHLVGLKDGLNSTITSAVNFRIVTAIMRDIGIHFLTVAIAPERSMSAKVRSIAIRPGRDSPTVGTKIVMSTRRARRKLRGS
jgi:hypothetical protein